MKRKTPWLLVLGFVLSITLGVLGWTTLSVQAHTKPSVRAWTEPPVVQAQLPTLPPETLQEIDDPPKPPLDVSTRADAGDISLCYTCGGRYPNNAGAFNVPSGTRPIERGSNCSGGLVNRVDSRPRLCSNY